MRLPDHDTLKAVIDLCCDCLPSTTEHGCHKLTNHTEVDHIEAPTQS